MEVEFDDDDLDQLDTAPSFTAGWLPAIVRAFRMRMQIIRAAPDERDFYAHKSWHFERLQGQRQHQHSLRLNDKYRLILELEGSGREKRVRIMAIEDYH